MKKYGTTGAVFFLLLVLVLFVFSLTSISRKEDKFTYSQLQEMLTKGKVDQIKKVIITNGESIIQVEKTGSDRELAVIVPNESKNDLVKELNKAGIPLEVREPDKSSFWFSMVSSFFLPILLLVGFLFMFRSAQSGGNQAMSFGRSRAKLMVDSKVKVSFSDVAGIDEAKQELQEIVDFLKNPEKFQALGARIPRGVLLVGAPGTGKTLLAKAVAGEAGVPFFSISGSDFVEMFVGVGASRVRDLFEQAKKHAPCIVFVDEIDAVGRQRGAGLGGGHDEREQTLNQLLVEMDGFEGTTGIIVVAATNRPDILDSALLRPGRFDRQVVIDRPDVLGREQILSVHSKGKPLAKDVDLKILARRTPGFTGADLSNLINEAALIAARADKREIEMPDMETAIDKVVAGPEKKTRIISQKEKEMTAYHEVGHALMCTLLKHAHPLHKVSIIPRGFALGLTMFLPEEDITTQTRSQLMDQIGVGLGGRVAEEIVYGEITTGAQDDLEKATKLSRRMVTEFGMSERLGPMTFGKRYEHVFLGRDFGHDRDYGEHVATIIDEEVRHIINQQYEIVKDILQKHRPHMDALVKVLLEKESLEVKEFEAILEEVNRQLAKSPDSEDHPGISQPPTGTGEVTEEATTIKLTETINQDKEPPQDPDKRPGLKPKFA
ncbi:MAG: ATP-dependent zinc metalloprotease FtsH [Candidatus Melainabacteria bacterium]|nr:ATP-dependent zinc metalloprotease FtsH [Candidatus Melainabacteria bacterium]